MSLIKFLAKYEDIQSINRTHSGKALSAYALEKNREHYQSLAWYQYKPYVRFLQAVVVMLISFGLLFLLQPEPWSFTAVVIWVFLGTSAIIVLTFSSTMTDIDAQGSRLGPFRVQATSVTLADELRTDSSVPENVTDLVLDFMSSENASVIVGWLKKAGDNIHVTSVRLVQGNESVLIWQAPQVAAHMPD